MKTKLLTLAIVMVAIAAIVKATTNAPSVAPVQTVVEATPAVPVTPKEDQLGGDDQPTDNDPSVSAEEVAAKIADGLAAPEATPPAPETPAPVAPPVIHDTCPDPMICKNEDCNRDYAIVFSGKFCTPCKRMHQFVARLQAEGYRVYFWEIESFPAAGAKYKIDLTPTTLFFNEGKEQKRFRGVIGEQPFRDLLKPRPKTKPKYDFIGE